MYKQLFNEFYQRIKLPEIDLFFESRNYDYDVGGIYSFFQLLIRKYFEIMNSDLFKYPLIFILEDCHYLDEVNSNLNKISCNFINEIELKIPENVIIICSFQDPIAQSLVKEKNHFFEILNFEEREFFMEKFLESYEILGLIRNHLEGKFTTEKIDNDLTKVLIQKSFKGVPLLILDILDSLLVKFFKIGFSVCSTSWK